MSQRIGPDGKPAQDVVSNPKANARKAELQEERRRLAEEAAAPWSRERLEREIERLANEPSVSVFEGKEVRNRLNLAGEDLSGLDLSGLNLAGANLHGAKLAGADLTGASLSGANLSEADLSAAVLKGADLGLANLSKAQLFDADVTEASLKKANLSEAEYEGAKGLDIQEKVLTPAVLLEAKYKQAEGFKVDVRVDEGVAVYAGDQLEGANITGLVKSKEPIVAVDEDLQEPESKK